MPSMVCLNLEVASASLPVGVYVDYLLRLRRFMIAFVGLTASRQRENPCL